MEINQRIKELRLQNGLTLEEVAKTVGVAKATVQRWESGLIANMKRDKIVALAKALHTTPGYILGIENSNYGINNGIIGNTNINNIVQRENLSLIDEAILTICSGLPEQQKSQVLAFATNLLNNLEGENGK